LRSLIPPREYAAHSTIEASVAAVNDDGSLWKRQYKKKGLGGRKRQCKEIGEREVDGGEGDTP